MVASFCLWVEPLGLPFLVVGFEAAVPHSVSGRGSVLECAPLVRHSYWQWNNHYVTLDTFVPMLCGEERRCGGGKVRHQEDAAAGRSICRGRTMIVDYLLVVISCYSDRDEYE